MRGYFDSPEVIVKYSVLLRALSYLALYLDIENDSFRDNFLCLPKIVCSLLSGP